jgi:Tfp pilus assembly pilus retraction ATPase PilT
MFGKVNEEDLSQIIEFLLTRPLSETTIDISYEQSGTRFRVNISRVIHGLTISMRTIPSIIPEPEAI